MKNEIKTDLNELKSPELIDTFEDVNQNCIKDIDDNNNTENKKLINEITSKLTKNTIIVFVCLFFISISLIIFTKSKSISPKFDKYHKSHSKLITDRKNIFK